MSDWRTNPFKVGEIIEFCGDRYTVIKNYGDHGVVREDGIGVISPFYWHFCGEDCKRVEDAQS